MISVNQLKLGELLAKPNQPTHKTCGPRKDLKKASHNSNKFPIPISNVPCAFCLTAYITVGLATCSPYTRVMRSLNFRDNKVVMARANGQYRSVNDKGNEAVVTTPAAITAFL